jgi:hypothetical protein
MDFHKDDAETLRNVWLGPPGSEWICIDRENRIFENSVTGRRVKISLTLKGDALLRRN